MRRLLILSCCSLFPFFGSAPGRAQEPVPATAVKELRANADTAWAKKDYQTATTNYRKVVDQNAKDGEAWHRLGYSLHMLGKLDDALAAHEKAAAFPAFSAHGNYNAACVHALKGDKEKAFAWLDKAAAAGFDQADVIQGDSDLESLRADPQFAAFVAKVQKNATSGASRLQVYAKTTERRRNRVAWFSRTGSPGQVTIEFAALPWQEKYDADVGNKEQMGKKWRLGADFWTSLDSSLAMKIAGVEVPAGYYYLTLEQREDDKFVLALHDAAGVKKLKLDAYVAQRLSGGIEIPMSHTTSKEIQKVLDLAVTMAEGSDNAGMLHVRFGGHDLSAKVEFALGR